MRITGLQQGDYGCLLVAVVAIGVEVAGAKNQQMISHAVARHKRTHPVATTAVVLAAATTTVCHLLEWLDPNADPFHRTYELLSRFRRQKIQPATPARMTAMSGT